MPIKRLAGSGAAGVFTLGTDKFTHAVGIGPTQYNFDSWLAGVVQRNVFAGGGQHLDFAADAVAFPSVPTTIELAPWTTIGIDNRGSRISGFTDANGATLVVQFRFELLVSNAAINITPVVYNVTAAGNATITGASACSATDEGYVGDVSQQQAVALTLPNAHNYFRPRITVNGTPAPGYYFRATAFYDCFVLLP